MGGSDLCKRLRQRVIVPVEEEGGGVTEGRREDKTVDAKKEEEMNDGRVRLKQVFQ